MPIPLGNPIPKPELPRRRSMVGQTIRGAGWLSAAPWHWTGAQRISRGGAFIGYLVQLLRFGPPGANHVQTSRDGAFDLEATALLYDVTPHEVAQRISRWRRQTARLSYATFGLAVLFFVGWLWQALNSPWTGARIASTFEFLPFCGLLFLMSFYNALLNFQIRTGRAASWREYLMTNEPFLPR